MADIYFSGQGNVFLADRDASGNPIFFRNIGNVPALKLSLSTDSLDHHESQTGSRLQDLHLVTGNKAELELTLENFTKENLKLLLYGTSTNVAGSTITNESLGTRTVGDIVALAHPLTSALSVHDSTGSPLTLTLNTDYSVDLGGGMIKILNLSGYVQPFKVNYTYATSDIVPAFKAGTQVERYLKFTGLNTANANNLSYFDLYRVVFDPVADLDIINDELAQFQLKGNVLYDSTRGADATLGGFGRIIQANPWS